MPAAFQQQSHEVANVGLIINHQDSAAGRHGRTDEPAN
jgi:hypothetical protein